MAQVGRMKEMARRPAAREGLAGLYYAPLDDPTNVQQFDLEEPTELIGDYSELSSQQSRTGCDGPASMSHEEDCELEILEDGQQNMENVGDAVPPFRPAAKCPRRCIVDSLHLATLVSCYQKEFNSYSKGRKKSVTQLVPALVWKPTYIGYKAKYPVSPFAEETLKDKLRETLKELKTGTSNNEVGENVALQDEENLNRLRSTDGHAKRNVLKRRQSIIEGNPIQMEDYPPEVKTPSPTVPSKGKGLPTKSPLFPSEGKLKGFQTKAQMLEQQSTSIACLAQSFSQSNLKREEYLEKRMEVLEDRHKKQKIENLKAAMEFSVLSQEEFKQTVKVLLGLEV